MRTNLTISRREILRRLGGAVAACAMSLIGWRHAVASQAAADLGEALSQSLEALRSRDYSETGVSMILACEDLTRDQPGTRAAADAHIVEAFDHYSRLYLAAHPDATEDDVAAIVEYIAHRDFLAGGRKFPL